jgi:hypothetical protein
MKCFLTLLVQDMILAYRSGHFLITGILLVIMVALVLFLPEEVNVHNELVLDSTPGKVLATYMRERGLDEGVVYTDGDAFHAALEKQPMKVGVVFSGGIESPEFEIISRNSVAETNISLLEALLDRAVLEMRGEHPDRLEMEFLRPVSGPIAFNLKIIPIVIVFEVVLLGFFIAAVMMFQEKQEATLLAYRVTPSGALTYILSKNTLFLLLSIAYGVPILLVGFGLAANYPLALLLIILSSSLMTMLSLAIAVFFRNLSEWFFPGVAVLIINSLPMLSYSLPSFAPTWMTWIPSYPAVFSVREVLFNGAGLAAIQPAVTYLVTLNLAAFIAAYAAVRFKLLKEGR